MKLASMLDHIRTNQTVQVEENLKIVAEGTPDTKAVRDFSAKTVGVFWVEDGDKMRISVYDK